MGDTPTLRNDNPSPTFRTFPKHAKENFKTFALLQQQESLISKFESHLHKTWKLIQEQPDALLSPRNNKTDESKEEEVYRLETLGPIDDDSRDSKPKDDVRYHPVPAKKLSEHKTFKESRGPKEIVRSAGSHPDILTTRSGDMLLKVEDLSTNNDDNLRPRQGSLNSLGKQEQVRIDGRLFSPNKKEMADTMSKKSSPSGSKRNDKSKLEKEVLQLKEENIKLKEALEEQKKMTKSSTSGRKHKEAGNVGNDKEDMVPKAIFQQVLKDKQELEQRYNDLFSSYSMLLDLNRALSKKLEGSENENKDGDLSSKLEKPNLTPTPAANNSERTTVLKDNLTPSQTYDSSIGRIRKNKDRERTVSNFLISYLEDERELASGGKSIILSTPFNEESFLKPRDTKMNEIKAIDKWSQLDFKRQSEPLVMQSARVRNDVVPRFDKGKGGDSKETAQMVCKTEASEKENRFPSCISSRKSSAAQKLKRTIEKEVLGLRSQIKSPRNQQKDISSGVSPKENNIQSLKNHFVSPPKNILKLKHNSNGLKKSQNHTGQNMVAKKTEALSPKGKKVPLLIKVNKRN